MGRGLPIIWTCYEKDFKELHFDIRQYNCIIWDNHADLAKKLQQRIEATVGKGANA